MPPSTGTPLRDRMSGSKQQAAGVSDARNGRGNARARGSSAGGARAARAEQRMAHGTHRAASATSTQADRRTSTSSAYPVLILRAIATNWCLPSRGRGRKSGGGQAVAVTTRNARRAAGIARWRLLAYAAVARPGAASQRVGGGAPDGRRRSASARLRCAVSTARQVRGVCRKRLMSHSPTRAAQEGNAPRTAHRAETRTAGLRCEGRGQARETGGAAELLAGAMQCKPQGSRSNSQAPPHARDTAARAPRSSLQVTHPLGEAQRCNRRLSGRAAPSLQASLHARQKMGPFRQL